MLPQGPHTRAGGFQGGMGEFGTARSVAVDSRVSRDEIAATERKIAEMQRKMGQMIEDLSALNDTVRRFHYGKRDDENAFSMVGIKDRRVPDSAMTASSNWADGYQAWYGRLDNTGDPRGFWHPANGANKGAWIQVDLGYPIRVVGVITQGRPGKIDDWVTSYKILYGNSPSSLVSIQDQHSNGDLVFQGNRDKNTKVANLFPMPVTARFFRLQVLTFTRMPVIRLEYLTN